MRILRGGGGPRRRGRPTGGGFGEGNDPEVLSSSPALPNVSRSKIVDASARAAIHADAFRDSHVRRRPLYWFHRTESEAIEMSDDTPETPAETPALLLRREALL